MPVRNTELAWNSDETGASLHFCSRDELTAVVERMRDRCATGDQTVADLQRSRVAESLLRTMREQNGAPTAPIDELEAVLRIVQGRRDILAAVGALEDLSPHNAGAMKELCVIEAAILTLMKRRA